jgi:hypothetical protein
MTWKPIKTAPVDCLVELGRWVVDHEGKLHWRSEIGFGRHSTWWGGSRSPDYIYYISHWRYLPDPPPSHSTRETHDA